MWIVMATAAASDVVTTMGLPNVLLQPVATVMAPLVALVGVLGAAVFAYSATVGTARRNLLIDAVTKERAVWRTDTRANVASLIAEARSLPLPASRMELAEFDRLRVEVRLRLNWKETDKHPLDRCILAALRELRTALLFGRQVACDERIEAIEMAVQKLLKEEWSKSKDEADSGRLTPSKDSSSG